MPGLLKALKKHGSLTPAAFELLKAFGQRWHIDDLRIGNSNGLLASPRRPPPPLPPAPPPPGRGRVTRRAAPASAACSPAARGGTRSGQAPRCGGGQISKGILHTFQRGF